MNKLSRGVIIPHAGQSYSGIARDTCLVYLPRTAKKIIYLAALHQLDNTENVYVLDTEIDFLTQLELSDIPFMVDDNISNNEHSYKWVKDELLAYFNPGVKILAIAPSNKTDINSLVNWLISIFDNDTVLIATTDLTHYGEKFNNDGTLDYPQQLGKIRREERLILDLTKTNITSLESTLHNIACGTYAVLAFIHFADRMNWLGRVVDYYDSHHINNMNDKLSLYTIDHNNVSEFVSYVSIVYGNYTKNIVNKILPVDIYLVLGLFKSIINYQKLDISTVALKKFKLPIWSSLASLKNGVFMGTELDIQTNCCTGIFQSRADNLSKNINNASRNCFSDANDRWDIPYTGVDLNELTYKIDILDDITNWKSYPSNVADQVFNMNGKYGMQLKFKNGNTAIFIPQVAEDNKDKWDIVTYMRQLTEKAYQTSDVNNKKNNKDNWKSSGNIIKIFSSKSYKFNPRKNILHKI